MAEPRVAWIKWHLDEDGGGEAQVGIDKGSHIDEVLHVFDSLDRHDQVPNWVADAIRHDGRERGKIPGK